MPKPDYSYRINPARSVQVFGEFTEDLAAKLLPEIFHLRKLPDPISVLIHSRGGTIRCLEILLGALRSKDADGGNCRVITAAAGECASAAATLLTLGDYAIGYEHSVVYFHGIRFSETEVTMEDAAQMATYLNSRNREIAAQLAHLIVGRLMLRFAKLKGSFEELRNELKKPDLSMMECFIWTLKYEVSDRADVLIDRAMLRLSRVKQLLPILMRAKLDKIKDPLRQDAKVLDLVIRYEIKNTKVPWRLDDEGMAAVLGDYFLLRDFFFGSHRSTLQPLIDLLGPEFLNDQDLTEFKRLNAESKEDAKAFLVPRVLEAMEDFWYFTVSLARNLQQGENRLSSTDAYWLGVLDEITGTSLQGMRAISEKESDSFARLT